MFIGPYSLNNASHSERFSLGLESYGNLLSGDDKVVMLSLLSVLSRELFYVNLADHKYGL